MLVKKFQLSQGQDGGAVIKALLNVPPNELSEINRKIAQGEKYEIVIKPYHSSRTLDQNACIWAKIGEMAKVLYASKEDIYEEMLRRYGPITPMRIKAEALGEIEKIFRIVDVVPEREHGDGTVFIKAYRGLSQMDTAEAARLLEGILDECKEIGISSEVKNE